MKKILIYIFFLFLMLIRWVTLSSPLPREWTPESKIGFTTIILDYPEYTDTQTIIVSGIWRIKMKGYKEIIPGERIKFVGKVDPKMVMGKVTQLKMTDPKVETVSKVERLSLNNLIVHLNLMRAKWMAIIRRSLPEPMASLSGGILLGVKDQMSSQFYQDLVRTGTLHMVAASGYNVAIVAAALIRTTSLFLSRGLAIAIAVAGIVIYVILSGAGASVVRAGIMGSLTLIAYYFGRPAEARRLLMVAAYIMLAVNPLLILDVGFQLSFAATMGLLYVPTRLVRQGGLVGEYLIPTLTAAIATSPIIVWHFGRISWISPLANVLILPLVPVVMELTAMLILVGIVAPRVATVFSALVYPALWYIVFVIRHL